MIKRHTKPTKENKGGIISKESFIHQSNVKNLDTSNWISVNNNISSNCTLVT